MNLMKLWKKAKKKKLKEDCNIKNIIFRRKFEERMKGKYRLFLAVVIIFTSMMLFYTIIFCSIYSKSEPGWFNGGILGVFIDLFIISIAIPLVKTVSKILVRKSIIFRPLILIEYAFFFLNFIL